jgi:hypothetical protein
MKADAEWQSLENKVRGEEVGWQSTRVMPLLATIPCDESDRLAKAVMDGMMDLSTKIPGAAGERSEVAVGSLDINFGVKLPAEELIGRRPEARCRRFCSKHLDDFGIILDDCWDYYSSGQQILRSLFM